MGIEVKLQAFEGPLDLLLHLIEKNKVNIYDIPIAVITDQYLEYVKQMDRTDLNLVSEFLVMAATLLDIKSRMLLPREVNEEGEEEDPRQELVEQLLEYKLFRHMSAELKERQTTAEKLFFKDSTLPPEIAEYRPPVNMKELVGDLTLSRLNAIFQDVMKRQEDKIDPIRSRFGRIEKEEISLSDRLTHVRHYLTKHRQLDFRELLLDNPSKLSTIVTFLVVLELIKTGFVSVEQKENCGEIQIQVTGNPEEIKEMQEIG